jgi:hypothetical protein
VSSSPTKKSNGLWDRSTARGGYASSCGVWHEDLGEDATNHGGAARSQRRTRGQRIQVPGKAQGLLVTTSRRMALGFRISSRCRIDWLWGTVTRHGGTQAEQNPSFGSSSRWFGARWWGSSDPWRVWGLKPPRGGTLINDGLRNHGSGGTELTQAAAKP